MDVRFVRGQFAALADDPAATHPDAQVLPSAHALRDWLREALDAGAVSVLLDNFSEAAMREAVALNAAKGNQALLEVSGGVAIDQLRWIAATGVDRISIGRLTKDVKAVDYSMRVENPV